VAAFVIAWGLLGKAQADKVGYTCKVPAGPMCFVWERSGLGKAQDAVGNIIDDATKSGTNHE
jgi:hypothetical protein